MTRMAKTGAKREKGKFLIVGIIFVALLVLFLSYKFYFSTPQIISASVYPSKIREGDILSITAEIKDLAGISSVEGVVQHERGNERIKLSLTDGTARNGTWKGYWIAHSTKNQKWYPLNLTITNIFGKTELASLMFQDPLQNHSASEITAGTFDTGDYVFPGDLNVTSDFYVNSTSPALFVNSTSGNVGIGTTSPINKLTVAGTSDINGQILKLAGPLEGNSYVRCGSGSSINGTTIVCNNPHIAPSNARKFGSYNVLPLGSFAEAMLLICRALGAERDINYTTSMDSDHNLYYTLSTNLWSDSYGEQLSVNQLVCGPSCNYWEYCPD